MKTKPIACRDALIVTTNGNGNGNGSKVPIHIANTNSVTGLINYSNNLFSYYNPFFLAYQSTHGALLTLITNHSKASLRSLSTISMSIVLLWIEEAGRLLRMTLWLLKGKGGRGVWFFSFFNKASLP